MNELLSSSRLMRLAGDVLHGRQIAALEAARHRQVQAAKQASDNAWFANAQSRLEGYGA